MSQYKLTQQTISTETAVKSMRNLIEFLLCGASDITESRITRVSHCLLTAEEEVAVRAAYADDITLWERLQG